MSGDRINSQCGEPAGMHGPKPGTWVGPPSHHFTPTGMLPAPRHPYHGPILPHELRAEWQSRGWEPCASRWGHAAHTTAWPGFTPCLRPGFKAVPHPRCCGFSCIRWCQMRVPVVGHVWGVRRRAIAGTEWWWCPPPHGPSCPRDTASPTTASGTAMRSSPTRNSSSLWASLSVAVTVGVASGLVVVGWGSHPAWWGGPAPTLHHHVILLFLGVTCGLHRLLSWGGAGADGVNRWLAG